VDFAFEAPIYTIATLYILARITKYGCKYEQFTIQVRLENLIASGLILVFAVGSVFSFRGSEANLQGVIAANEGDWENAQALFCEAKNQNPQMTLYNFQCGLASAVLADITDDANFLGISRAAYEHGLNSDPYWPLHQASAAAVEWAAGDNEAGLLLMKEAQANAPKSAFITLNLGWMYEQLNQDDLAFDAFQLACQLNPWLIRTISEVSSFLCNPLTPEIRRSIEENFSASFFHAWEGWILLDKGALRLAESSFLSALDHNPWQIEAYAGLAKLAYLQDDLKAAENYLKIGKLTGGSSPVLEEVKAEWAKLNYQEEVSLSIIHNGVAAIFWSSSSAPYYESVYGRAYLPIDSVPQLIQLPIATSLSQGYERGLEFFTSTIRDQFHNLLPWYENQLRIN
jgi:tetratricopeptide (TPR) repeat protein